MYRFVYQGPSREDWMGVGVPTDVKDYAIDSGSLTFATFPDFREISTNLILLQIVIYLQSRTVRQTHNAVI